MSSGMFDKMLTNLSLKKEPEIHKQRITNMQLEHLDIVATSAHITIAVHNEPHIDMVLKTYEKGPELIVTESDQELAVTVETHHQYQLNYNDLIRPAVHLTIVVPKDLIQKWHIQTTSGNVRMDQLVAQSLHVTASSGNLKLSKLILQTGVFKVSSGNITLDHLHVQRSIVEATSGNLLLKSCVFHEVELECSSGNVRVYQLQAFQLTTSVSSGQVKLIAVKVKHIEARATSGHIRTEFLNQDLNLTVDATVKTGAIVCRLPLTDKKETNHKLTGMLGDGSGRCVLKASSGRITIA